MAVEGYASALVTGASSGIGAATVRRLRADGLEVHAVARDEARLQELAEATGCVPHVVDIGDLDRLDRLAREIEIDILVNNAGQSRQGNILDASAADVNALVDVNLRAVLHLIRLFVPRMKARDRGHVINISSIAGHYAFGGGNTTYHATKAAVHSLTQQLRVDLYGSNVRVTEVSPARVETEVFARQIGDAAEARRRFFEGYDALQPEDIADTIAFVIGAPARMNVSFVEVMPTMQVVGGLNFARRPAKPQAAA